MIRKLWRAFSVLAVLSLLGLAGLVGYFAFMGTLTAESAQAAWRAVSSGDSLVVSEQQLPPEVILPDHADVTRKRAERVLDFSSREGQLEVLETLLRERAEQLKADQADLAERETTFREEVEALAEEAAAEATDLSRGVLQAMRPADAGEAVMELPTERAATVLGGMPVDAIAGILRAMAAGPADQRTRGSELFRLLSDGEPKKTMLRDALGDAADGPTGAAAE